MAAVGSYSSLQLIAGAAITGGVNGPAFYANRALEDLLLQHLDIIEPVGYWSNTRFAIGNAVANNVISNATANAIWLNISGNAQIAIFTGSIQGSGANILLYEKWLNLFNETANRLELSTPLNRFEPVYSVAQGYVTQENQGIFSTLNATNASSVTTFQNQNNVSTGGLTQITLSPQLFAQDIVNLGTAIDLENLTNLGSPESLLKQIAQVTRISTPLYNALVLNGIPQNTVDTILASNLSDREQKIVYRVMEQITGSVLTEILGVLRVRTENILSLADLLNPIKAFPKSYTTLTAPTVNGLRGIYKKETTNVNSNLATQLPQYVLKPLDGLLNSKNTYASLQKIIPPDQALAWKALQAGLETVTSIQNSILSLYGISTPGMETMKWLPAVANLSQPVPSSVQSYFLDNNLGSGVSGSYNIGDILGVVAAASYDEMAQTLPLVTQMMNSGVAEPLGGNLTIQGLFPTIDKILGNVYGNNPTIVPSNTYGAGIYGNIQEAIYNGIVLGSNGAPKAIGQVVALGGKVLVNANELYGVVCRQVDRQEDIMNAAGISFSEITSTPKVIGYGTWNQLPEYALETTRWNSAWFYQQIACVSSLGGQAVLGTLRESRNNQRLANAALLTNIVVSDANPQPEPANLTNAQYTAKEAANLKAY